MPGGAPMPGPTGMPPMPEAPAGRSGVRTALIVSSLLLVLVVVWIVLLLLERYGLVQLPF